MGLLTSPLCCAAKCCGCIILSQLLGLLLSIGSIVIFIAIFYFYILPWGEDKIISELGLPQGTDINSIDASVRAANNCSGCVFGTNTDWPTNTTGTLHFLDTSAGTTISSVVATALVATAATGAGTMLWASIFPTMASVLSFSGGFYEMTHILEAAQYIGIIGQLQLRGAPKFLDQFSKELAWTNFNIPKSVSSKFLPTRRLDLADTGLSAVQPKFAGETGPTKYAKTLGVEPKDLFFYTLKIFAAVVVIIHILYVVIVMIASCLNKKKSFGDVAGMWYRKVVWACLLALLLAQYIFAMSGSYYIYENSKGSGDRDSRFGIGCALLAVVIGFALIFGIAIVANNTDELKDIGSIEHDQRPFAAKYSAYYDEYNFDNRFFFVPRILLAVGTGIIVGIIQEPMTQLLFILGATFLYLVLILLREPNLLRFLYYIALISVFLKVVLLCLMLVLVQDDFFPQHVRDKVSYAIIGINIFIFFLLFLRQAYLIVYKIIRACKSKGQHADVDDSDDESHGHRRDMENGSRHPGYQRLNSAREVEGRPNVGDTYTQNQQYKEQTFLNAQQQASGYGRSDPGFQSGAAVAAGSGVAAGYGAGRYGQQQQDQRQQQDMYSRQHHPGTIGSYERQSQQQASYQADPRRNEYNPQSYGGIPGQSSMAPQNRYGSGAEPAFSAGTQASAPSGPSRTVVDRYIGPEAAAALGAGAGIAAVAAVNNRQQQEQQAGSEGINRGPEKFTWRRNMERRAAEAAATDQISNPPSHRRSFVRFDSDDDSYGTNTQYGGSERDFIATNESNNAVAAVGAVAPAAIQRRSSSPRLDHSANSYGTETEDLFMRRFPTDLGSDASGDTFVQTSNSPPSLRSESSRGHDDNVASSFLTADSYASSRQGTLLESHRSFDGSVTSSQSGAPTNYAQKLEDLAVVYLQQAGGVAAAAENDIGDEDDEDEGEATPLIELPKRGASSDDRDETESIDIDAIQSDDTDDDDDLVKTGDRDIDLDEESVRGSVDIDEEESDGDIDIDSISSRDNDSMLEILSTTQSDRDSYSDIKRVDEIGLRESLLSAQSPSHINRSSLRDSYLSAGTGYERGMSQISTRSDDDASFYIEGRREDENVQARQQEREKMAGPLKL